MASAKKTDDDGDAHQKVMDSGILQSRPDKPKTAVDAKKQPPPEKPEAVWLRSKVVFSFWAVIIFLGLPMWWKTTSIYRARLPIQEMLEWSEGTVCFICSVHRSVLMVL
jgi:GPI-anchor transamidase subunit S